MNEELKDSIKQRILDELRKHPTLDWVEIAARKIATNIEENYIKNVLEKVTRLTVVTENEGRVFEQWNSSIKHYLQDDERTLKLILWNKTEK